MKELFKRTKMMQEAKEQGKPYRPSREFLSFMIVYMLSNYLQSIILSVCSLYYFLSDKKLFDIMHSSQINMQKALERMEQLMITAPEWLSILILFLSIVFFIGTIIYCKSIDKRKISTLGLRKANILSEYAVGFIAGFIMISLVAALGIFTGTLKYNGLNKISLPVLVAYFLAYAVQGFSEEVLVRGYYMTAIAKTTGVTYALITSSVIFAFVHSMNFGLSMISFMNLFLIGILIGMYVIKRGNIWGACSFHFAWNFTQMIFFGFNYNGTPLSSSVFSVTATKGFESVNGGIYGPEGGLFVTLIVFLAIGGVYKLKQNEKEIAVIEVKDEVKDE